MVGASGHRLALARRGRALDTSNNLRASGIIALALPAETTTDHTLLPPELAWVRATVPGHSRAACKLVRVANNAVEAVFVSQGDDDGRLATSLPEKTVSKLRDKLAAVKSVAQPFASFGGRIRESPETVTRRAAERLRHRDRGIGPWDYERLLLEAFPHVRKIKCIPHASDKSWFAPGHVLVVVVPDLRNRHAVDSLAPRVDIDTLDRMRKFAQARVGVGSTVLVRNPRYRAVRLDFKVRFRPGEPFLFQPASCRKPWSACSRRGRATPGADRVRRSRLPFGPARFCRGTAVRRFRHDFKLFVETEGDVRPRLARGAGGRPDEILASAAEHAIQEFIDV